MDRVEFIGKLVAIYAGDKRASHEIIEEYDRLKENYERIYNENCKLREEHNITDIKLLDENNRLKNIIDELEKYKKAIYEIKEYIDAYSPYFLETQEENNQTIAIIINNIGN